MLEFSRRRLLGTVAGLTPLLLSPFPILTPQPSFAADTAGDGRRFFTPGVASGDPLSDGVVLWTRLAPDPIHGGGMGREPVEVTWEIATDDKMQRIVRRGSTIATADFAHSVHVEVDGLEPARWYWYRFRTAKEESRIGRTRTAPAPGVMAERLRFAVGSCQSWDTGHFTAHRHLAEEDLDLFVFLGDYIYEGMPGDSDVRRSNPQDTDSLDGFRNRHAHYKSDPNLQASHAAFPWLVTWDDHEVINDYAGDNGDPATFLKLRAAAYRAYYEHMPLRRSALPKGPDMLLYRDVAFGRLVTFDILDTRQYRTALPCGGWRSEACADSLSPERTITGGDQETWLYQRLRHTSAQWNVLAQQVPMMQRLIPEGQRLVLAMDKWEGYARVAQPAAPRDRAGQDVQPDRSLGRHPFGLGRRPQGRFRRAQVGDAGHGVRLHVNHLGW